MEGTGDFSDSYGYERAPWYEHRDKVKTAEVNVAGMKNAANMFYDCSNLTSLDLSKFDTSQVTYMYNMFTNCSNLNSLDLSGFDTSQVTNMSSMFSNCSILTSLDLSKFDTSLVTDMSSMFFNCHNLTSLDLSGFATSSVTNMGYMFSYCSNLTEIDLSSFDASNVTSADLMFSGCNKLQIIHTPCNLKASVALPSSGEENVNTWQQPDGTILTELPQNLDHSILIQKNAALRASKSGTYYGLGETINLDDLTVTYYGIDGTIRTLESSDYTTNAGEIDTSVAGVKTLIITYNDGSSTLTDQIELTVIDKKILVGGEYKENGNDITWVIDADGKLTVEGTGEFAASYNYNSDRAPWYEYRDKVKTAEVNVTEMKNAFYMFYGCSNLTSLDLSKFDTSQVTNMSGMFMNCYNLTSLDLSKFDTSQVTNMSHVFRDCYSLTSLDLSKYDTSQVTNMSHMFSGCFNLISLDLSKFDTSNVTSMGSMFSSCRNLTEIDLSNFDVSKVTDAGRMFEGCYKVQTIHTPYNLKVSVSLQTSWYGDVNTWQQPDGTVLTELPQNLDHSILIQKHAALEVFKTKTDYLCGEVLNLDDLTVTYYGIDSIKPSIIQSNEYTTNAHEIDMSVKGKKTLIITYNDGTSILTSEIELSVLNPDDVIANGEYTENGSNTTWVIYANGKFILEGTGEFTAEQGYARAPWNNYRKFIKSAEIKVTGMKDASKMFAGCYNLTSVDVSQFDTSQVTNMSSMFSDCSSLASLDLSKFDTSQTTNMSSMFYGCSSLTSLDLSRFDTSKVTDMSYVFSNCRSLTSLDLSRFDTSNVTDMSAMFYMDEYWEEPNDVSLTSLNLKNFNTSNVKNMFGMFWGCNSLKSLDLSSFDTSKAENMMGMFYGCSSLTDLAVSSFNTSQVIDMSQMFHDCNNLIDLDVSKFDTSQVTNMCGMFYDCSSLTDLAVSSFDTSQVYDMSEMFAYCTSLTSLDLHSFDTSKVYNIHKMFYGCNSLASLDLSSFDLGSLESWWDDEYIIFPNNKLQTMHTPYNLKVSIPLQGTWYQEDGTELTELPQNLDHSIFIRRNKDPLVSQLKASKGKTNYICGDKISLSDLAVIYYNEAGEARRLKGGEFTTNVGDISTSTEGKQILTITYRDGDKVFTDSIELTLTKFVLDANHVKITVADADSYVYDGTPKMPEVVVVYSISGNSLDNGSVSENSISRESVSENSVSGNSITMERDKDYSITYENNINAFEDRAALETAQNAPRAVITGRERYSGTVSAAFVIQKAAGPQAEECLETSDNVAQSGCTLDLSGYFVDYQKIGYTVGKPVEDDTAAGSVIAGQPSIDEKGILTYGTIAGTKGDFAVIPVTVSFVNYKDALINVKIMLGDGRVEAVTAPTASPESGRQLVAGSKVALACETAGAEIYYTTGASVKELTDPIEKGTRYTEPITVNHDMYIRTAAMKGSNRSKTVTFHYTVLAAADTEKVLKPYALPGQGIVEKGIKVELKSDTPETAVYYVTGKNADMLGAVPEDEAHKYTAPIEITEDIVIKAIARKDGMKDSDAAVFVYRVNTVINAPSADPGSGATMDQGSYISLKADSDANIYYTTDTSDPAVSGTAKRYETKIRVTGTAGSVIVIRAVAEKKGIYSETVTLTYTVSENRAKGLQVMLAGSDEFTYTGSAITPAVIVTNNGEELAEGEDYTVRYSNNVKAADKDANRAPKITITGKGNLTKSRSVTFSITPKDIGDEEEVVGGSIAVVKDKTASPVLFYGGVKLTAKDFVNQDAKKKHSQDGTITITGKGNFEGTRVIDVRVVDKNDLKKFTVAIDNAALKEEPLVYDGQEKTMDGYFEVFDVTDKSSPLEEYSDYAVIYPKNNINAGKVKFTVVGLGEYYGTVTKSYTIKPRVVKIEADGNMEVNVDDGDNYPFKNGGVTIPGLTVTCDGDVLIPEKDYKVTYGSNKKICTGNQAKCTVSFKGNYKGSKALVRKFNITPAVMDDVDQINGSVSVAVGDMVYTGKPGAYKSIPYVTVNGALLKSADYKVSYYKDQDRSQVIDGKSASSSVNLADSDRQTVYVKIEGKGNYEGTLTAQYNVYKLAENVIDLAKAKVSFVGGNKAEYTGEGVEPAVTIQYKSGGEWKTVDANDIGTYINVTYINNVNKGKATVMINGNGGKYVGSKTAGFNIVPKSMK